MSKLTEAQVERIKSRRQIYGYTYQYLADWYKVSKGTIAYHLNEKTNATIKKAASKAWHDRNK